MNQSISLAIVAVGVVLIIFGINAAESISSDISRAFTGAPTDKAVWMLVGGVAATIIGLVGMMRGSK